VVRLRVVDVLDGGFASLETFFLFDCIDFSRVLDRVVLSLSLLVFIFVVDVSSVVKYNGGCRLDIVRDRIRQHSANAALKPLVGELGGIYAYANETILFWTTTTFSISKDNPYEDNGSLMIEE